VATVLVAIADDLTGALEAAAKFAAWGVRVEWVDTESRHLAEREAGAAVERAAGAFAVGLIYKKTDSTLRGNIAAELRALARFGPVAYVPAYPALGRTVVNGELLVDGVPLVQTEFARDALNPVRCGNVRELVAGVANVRVFDGATDEDIERAAREILAGDSFRVIAGRAAIAEALARKLGPRPRPAIPWPRVRTCLVRNGSRSAVSRAQMQGVDGARWRAIETDPAPGMPAEEVARVLGTELAQAMNAGDWDAVMVMGGDTAYGFWRALGFPRLEPVGEILPGVPVSRMAGRREALITKAGGFGGPDLLRDLRRKLDAIG
jgi:uncharacterized protein YgbK (DUF1537 family)